MTEEQEWEHTKQVCHVGNWFLQEGLATWPAVIREAEELLALAEKE